MEAIGLKHEDQSPGKISMTDGQYLKRQVFGRSCSVAVSDGALDLGDEYVRLLAMHVSIRCFNGCLILQSSKKSRVCMI